MNESQKHSKAEMEILKYERKMMRESRIKRLKTRPLEERINFIKADSNYKNMTAEEIKIQLDDLGLGKEFTIEQIRQAMKTKES